MVEPYKIQPLLYKRFIRFFYEGGYNFFKDPTDRAALDIASNADWGIQVVFRFWYQTGGGNDWRDICGKWSAALDPGYGYRLQINSQGGYIRLATRDTGGTANFYTSTVGGLNDGKIYNLVMFQDRQGYTYFNYGEVGSGQLSQLGDRISSVAGLAYNNDGGFFISGPAPTALPTSVVDHAPYLGDIFLVRVFNEINLLSWNFTLNGDITRRIDTYDKFDGEYTNDPATQPGCVSEYLLDSPDPDAWDIIADSSGNGYDLESVNVPTRACYGNELIKWDSSDLDPSFHIEGQDVSKAGDIVPNIARHGGYDPTLNKVNDKKISLRAVFTANNLADHDINKNNDMLILNRRNNSIYDPYRERFARFSTARSFNDTEEELHNYVTRQTIELICPDPFWYKEFKFADPPSTPTEFLLDAGNNYTEIFYVNNTGNVTVYPRFMFCSYASPNGYIVVENLVTLESFSLGLVTIGTAYEDLLWEMSNEEGDDSGKCLYVDCNLGEVYALDYYESKQKFFNGVYIGLEPGLNRIKITGGQIGGNLGEIGVFMDYQELEFI